MAVRTYYVAQSLEQMRKAVPLTLDSPPLKSPLLVHRVYLFCESSRDSCPLRKQHVCWHSANGRSALHVGAAVRGFRSDGIVPMAAYSASSASCTVVITVFRDSISS
jgi:hypothetical protein